MQSKHLYRISICLLLLSLIVAACQPAVTPVPSEPQEVKPTEVPQPIATEKPAEPEPSEKTKVVIFVGLGTGTDPDQIKAQEALQEKFNSTHDNIEVEFLIVPNEESVQRLTAMIAGDDAPQLVGPVGVGGAVIFWDMWLDVQPFIDAENFDMSDFYGPAAAVYKFPDRTLGLPMGTYPSFIFYNKDLFDAAGVDYPTHDYSDKTWTLDKLREISIKLTLDTDGNAVDSPNFDPKKIAQYGFDDSWSGFRAACVKWSPPNVGLPMTADYKTAQVNAEEYIQCMQWIQDGIWKDRFMADAAGQEAIAALTGDPFGGGQVAMWYSHTWFMPEGLPNLKFEYDFAPVPLNAKGTRVARAHNDAFAIPKNAKNTKEAWEVMKWLVAPEQILEVCNIYGCVPARKSVAEAFRKQLEERYPGADMSVLFEAINNLDAPTHDSWMPESERIGNILDDAFNLIVTDPTKDVKQVLDEANAEVQKILDEYWANH